MLLERGLHLSPEKCKILPCLGDLDQYSNADEFIREHLVDDMVHRLDLKVGEHTIPVARELVLEVCSIPIGLTSKMVEHLKIRFDELEQEVKHLYHAVANAHKYSRQQFHNILVYSVMPRLDYWFMTLDPTLTYDTAVKLHRMVLSYTKRNALGYKRNQKLDKLTRKRMALSVLHGGCGLRDATEYRIPLFLDCMASLFDLVNDNFLPELHKVRMKHRRKQLDDSWLKKMINKNINIIRKCIAGTRHGDPWKQALKKLHNNNLVGITMLR